MKILTSIALGVWLIILACFLFACSVDKNIASKSLTDYQNAIRERDSLARKYSMDSAAWTNMIKTLTESGVVFENEPCPNVDSLKAAWDNNILHPTKENAERLAKEIDRLSAEKNRVEFNADGTIKSAEGRIKSANAKVNKWQQEATAWKKSYDELLKIQQRDTTARSVQYVEKIKDVKRTFIPWWIWVIAFAGLGLWLNERFRILPFAIAKRASKN